MSKWDLPPSFVEKPRCPTCRADISSYQRAEGEHYCPWCSRAEEQPASALTDNTCPECGSPAMQRQGRCWTCHACGASACS